MATFRMRAHSAVVTTKNYQQGQRNEATEQQRQTNLAQRAKRIGQLAGFQLQTQQQELPPHSKQQQQRQRQRQQPHQQDTKRLAQAKRQHQQQQQQQRRQRSWSVCSGGYAWAPPQRLATNSILRIDTLSMMITMLVVVTVMISGNAVFAAQRDSFKPKDTNNLSNNANAIPSDLSGGNGNAVSNGNTNNISNGNANNVNSHTSTTSGVGGQSSLSSSSTFLTTSTTTTASNGNLIASSSLQKGGSGGGGGGGSSMSGTSGINRNTIEVLEDTRNGPYFDKAASKNVTALLGKTAYLNCRVKNLGNKTMLLQVSWVRHRDIHLLTVGRYTYTSDQRFRAIHQPQTEDWILQIKYPQHRDSGIYECQVSTTPHMSHYIQLTVVEPSTEIIGAPDLYIESGSTINLTCVILNSPEPPAYIFWNHNNAIINYDSPRGGVSVVTNKGDTTTSFLLIKTARPSDSGHYQCNPSNAKPKSVTVHVLNGEFPAAMQRAGQAHHRMSQSHYLLVYLSMYFFTLAYVRRYIQLPWAAVGAAATGNLRGSSPGC